MERTRVKVRNAHQAILFNEELRGQISDGCWENSRPYGHWKEISSAEAYVAADGSVGCEGFVPARRYNFANKLLVDCVGQRMIDTVVEKTHQRYSLKELKRDLKDLSKIVNASYPTWR